MARKRIGTERTVYTKPNEMIYLLDCFAQRVARSYLSTNPDNANAKEEKKQADILHRMVDEFLNTGKATKYKGVYY